MWVWTHRLQQCNELPACSQWWSKQWTKGRSNEWWEADCYLLQKWEVPLLAMPAVSDKISLAPIVSIELMIDYLEEKVKDARSSMINQTSGNNICFQSTFFPNLCDSLFQLQVILKVWMRFSLTEIFFQ